MRSSDEVGPKLLRLLGIHDELVISAQITMRAGDAIKVELERYASTELEPNEDELRTVLKRYEVKEIGSS